MEVKYLWNVYIDNMDGEKKVITSERDIKEVMDVINKHGFENALSVKYLGEVLG